ncbi:MAG: hypothetical protein JSV89_00845 [Spirochaetaceae bacterium]|nr:MAG: hypothetical protein JSV89_00845 [Spirochaetaceae bacterium]
MEPTEFVVLLSRLATGAIATFFAILLWSQTRDVSWVLVIIGTLVSYAEIVFTTLESFGVVEVDFFVISGFPVLEMVLVNLPLVFLTLAFISMIVRKRLP